MDGRMTLTGVKALGPDYPEVIFLENIGNLVCPAEFDVGSDLKMMILSVPEGDDKPLTYPLVNKIDTAEIFDFDLERCTDHVRKLNSDMPVFPVSGKTGEGTDAVADWLRKKIRESGKRGAKA